MDSEATWFAYQYCSDVAAHKEFYGTLLGLAQIWDEPDDIAFRHGGVQLSFTKGDPVARPDAWAFQPGWANGQLPEAPEPVAIPSNGLALEPEQFADAVARLQRAGVESLTPEPVWVGYWSFVVRDPDGQTVEISDPVSAG